MSVIDRVLVMDLNKLAGVVVNLLIKSHRYLVGVNLFTYRVFQPCLPNTSSQYCRPLKCGVLSDDKKRILRRQRTAREVRNA